MSIFSQRFHGTITFMRHAKHKISHKKTVGGSLHPDLKETQQGGWVPLSKEGVAQARAKIPLVLAIKPDVILHTGAVRTKQTADIFVKSLSCDLIKIPSLIEQDWGPTWTGMNKNDRNRKVKFGEWPKDGENKFALNARQHWGMQRALEHKNALLIGHDTNVKALRDIFQFPDFTPHNCEVLRLVFNAESEAEPLRITRLSLEGTQIVEKNIFPQDVSGFQMPDMSKIPPQTERDSASEMEAVPS